MAIFHFKDVPVCSECKEKGMSAAVCRSEIFVWQKNGKSKFEKRIVFSLHHDYFT
jgi:hypothetical protein